MCPFSNPMATLRLFIIRSSILFSMWWVLFHAYVPLIAICGGKGNCCGGFRCLDDLR